MLENSGNYNIQLFKLVMLELSVYVLQRFHETENNDKKNN